MVDFCWLWVLLVWIPSYARTEEAKKSTLMKPHMTSGLVIVILALVKETRIRSSSVPMPAGSLG